MRAERGEQAFQVMELVDAEPAVTARLDQSPTSCSRFALAALAISMFVGTAFALPSGTALAHNTLLSSDPADGATLAVAPTQITWVSGKAVPLETMTVTLIDSTGARSELSGSTHGADGDVKVVTHSRLCSPASYRCGGDSLGLMVTRSPAASVSHSPPHP